EPRGRLRGVRRRDDRPVPSARRSSGLLPQLFLFAGSGNGLTSFAAVDWEGDAVVYLDQRQLPHHVSYERARTIDELERAIKTLAVRGAPCIGVFGAFGTALLKRTISNESELAAAL